MDAKREKGVGTGAGEVGNVVANGGSGVEDVTTENERSVEAEALTAGEDAVAAWRARRRQQPDYDRIDRRATKHVRYRMTDVHLKMSQEGFSYMEAVRQKMNFGRGMSQGEFVEWAFSIVRKRYGKAIREHQKEWAMRKQGERDESP